MVNVLTFVLFNILKFDGVLDPRLFKDFEKIWNLFWSCHNVRCAKAIGRCPEIVVAIEIESTQGF